MKDKKRSLMRDVGHGKVAGVCAGIADFFGLEVWLVRIAFVAAALLTGFGLPVLVYIALWLILDKQTQTGDADEPAIGVKHHVWQAGVAPSQALRDVLTRFEKLELRLRRVEACVTSKSFNLKREINNL